MKRMLITLVLVTATAAGAQEAVKRTPANAAIFASNMAAFICSDAQFHNRQVAKYRRDIPTFQAEHRSCVEAYEKIDAAYAETKPKAKTKAQRAALDNWKVEWMTALKSMESGMPEAAAKQGGERANIRLQMAFE